MRRALAVIPDGDYRQELRLDGFEEPLVIRARVNVKNGAILIDYDGTSAQVRRGINSVLPYTYSYTAFGVKSLLDPATPNNQGAFRPIQVTAPPGCFLNPLPPAPVIARNLTGHVLPFAVYGALASVMPDRVAAIGGSAPSWTVAVQGNDENGRPVSVVLFLSGGVGATSARDGNACMSFPGLVANVPIELTEHLVPVRILAKRLRPDSGGAGRQRGGLGQEIILESVAEQPIRVAVQAERIRTPADGLLGGRAGACGEVLYNGRPVDDAKGIITLSRGERIVLRLPGGGGFGQPAERSTNALRDDLLQGFVTAADGRK